PLASYTPLPTSCRLLLFFFLLRPPPSSPLFPYTTLFRSRIALVAAGVLVVELPEADHAVAPHDRRLPGDVLHHLQQFVTVGLALDRKSTRLNSSHVKISYAVFCLKKKNISQHRLSVSKQL